MLAYAGLGSADNERPYDSPYWETFYEITAEMSGLKEEVKASFDHRGLLPECIGVGAEWAVAGILLVVALFFSRFSYGEDPLS
jgi:hypothetical protein